MKIIEVEGMMILGERARVFRMGECAIILTREYGKWHLSISCKNRFPTWQEIHQARYDLIPNEAMMAMILPPKEQYVNLHENTFHLYEIKED